jgi:hypothetical protein
MDIKNDYGLRENEPGVYVATRNGFDVQCPHRQPTPFYAERKDEKGEPIAVRFPQENTYFNVPLCTSVCAKFHVSKKGNTHQLHCQHHGDIVHEMAPNAIKLIPQPKANTPAPEKEPQL